MAATKTMNPEIIVMEFVMAPMHNPPHPGRILMDTVCRDDGGISVTGVRQET
jgi:hypothetical protein